MTIKLSLRPNTKCQIRFARSKLYVMDLLYCGFNGFKQWESRDRAVVKPTKIEINNNYLPINGEIERFDVFIGWSHNLYVVNDKVFIKGFHLNNTNVTEELINPRGDLITDLSANDDYVLMYNTSDAYVWKYHLDDDMEQKWRLLPDFIRTDRADDGDVFSSRECILKIVTTTRMNVALANSGRIFNIPYEINVKCSGKIIDIACGHEHGILLTDSGNVYTWGGGSRCQLGHGNTENRDAPELVEALSGIKIVSISAGGWHCCAISEFGDLYTWGWNERGQLGVYNTVNNSKSILSTKEDIGDDELESVKHRKFIKNDAEENNLALPNYALPVLIDIYEGVGVLERNVVEVNCGSKHTVVKLDDGTVWGTGCNKYSQLGFDPEAVENVSHFIKLQMEDVKDYRLKCGAWATAFVPKI